MRVVLLFFTFFLGSIAHGAVPRLNFVGPDHRWIASDLKVTSSEHGDVYGQTFTRYLFEVADPYALGNISYVSIPLTPKNDRANSAKEVQKLFEKMLDIRPFHLTQYNGKKNQWMLEGEARGLGKWVRILITKHSTRWSISTAFLRKIYLDSIDQGAAQIQHQLAQREEQFIKSAEKKTSSVFSFIVPRAYAQSAALPGWVSSGGFLTPSAGSTGGFGTPVSAPGASSTYSSCPSPSDCTPGSVTYAACLSKVSDCRQAGIQAQLTGVRTDVKGLSENATVISDETNKTVSDTTAVITGTADKGITTAQSESDQWQAQTGLMNAEWGARAERMNAEWGARTDRGLDIMEKALSPSNVALMAAAGVAGASIAGFGVNLALEGISAAAEFLWGILSGASSEKEHQNIVQLFNQSKEKWDKLNDEAMELSRAIDTASGWLDLVKLSGKSLEQTIIDEKTKLVDLKTKVEDKKQKYDYLKQENNFDDTLACVVDAREEYVQLQKALVPIEAQLAKLEQVKANFGDFGDMCRVLNQNLEALLQMEQGLQDARIMLLKSYDHYQIEEDRRLEGMRTAGRELQVENAKKSFDVEMNRARESLKKGLAATQIDVAMDKAQDFCYESYIDRNGWDAFRCRMPLLDMTCTKADAFCARPKNKALYLYKMAYKDKSLDETEKKELQRAYRQYYAIQRTYDDALKRARQTYAQKTKGQDYLHYNEDTNREGTAAMHNWIMGLRQEQICGNLPEACDQKAGARFNFGEKLKKVVSDGKADLKCECGQTANCECKKIEKSAYFTCMRNRQDCEANKEGLTCYNLSQSPECPTDSAFANAYCRHQYKKCADDKLEVGCADHFSTKCEKGPELCSKKTKACREQAMNRARFKFEKIQVQADLIKNGSCKEYLTQ